MFVKDENEISSSLANYPVSTISIVPRKPIEFGMGVCTLGSLIVGIFLNPISESVQHSLEITPYLQNSFAYIDILSF